MKFYDLGRKKSRDLHMHIRKVSFSGSSVSSGSFSSTSSTASSSTVRDSMSHAPPRLHERPFIALDGRRYQDLPAFCDDSDDDLPCDHLPAQRRRRTDFAHHSQSSLHSRYSRSSRHYAPSSRLSQFQPDEDHLDMSLVQAGAEIEVDGSFFDLQFAKRPAMPSSRWSESTIATLQTLDEFGPATAASSVCEAAEEPEFAATRRPGIQHMDTFEHFVKKGGWKRRGIVFHSDDMVMDLNL